MTLHQLLCRDVKRRWGAFAFMTFLFPSSYAAAVATSTIAAERKDTTDLMQNISFRNIGPAAAGGRVSAIVGIPEAEYLLRRSRGQRRLPCH